MPVLRIGKDCTMFEKPFESALEERSEAGEVVEAHLINRQNEHEPRLDRCSPAARRNDHSDEADDQDNEAESTHSLSRGLSVGPFLCVLCVLCVYHPRIAITSSSVRISNRPAEIAGEARMRPSI